MLLLEHPAGYPAHPGRNIQRKSGDLEMARARKSGGGFGSFVVGFVVALVLAAGGGCVYFQFGAPPVAVVAPPFPFEKNIVRLPLNARIDREQKQPPFGTSEDVFEAGARVYRNDCASCHG